MPKLVAFLIIDKNELIESPRSAFKCLRGQDRIIVINLHFEFYERYGHGIMNQRKI